MKKLLIQLFVFALVFICSMLNPYHAFAQRLPDPTSNEIDQAIRINPQDEPKTWVAPYYFSTTQHYFGVGPWSGMLDWLFHDFYEHDSEGNYTRPSFNRMFVKPKHVMNCSFQNGWVVESWDELMDGQEVNVDITPIMGTQQEAYAIFDVFATFNNKDYIGTFKYIIKGTNRSDGRFDNSLIPQNKTISVGSAFDPLAISPVESDGTISYSGPYTNAECTSSSSAYTTNTQGKMVSTTTGTYYFKATQAMTARYVDATTVVTINVVNKKVPWFSADDYTCEVGSSISVSAQAMWGDEHGQGPITATADYGTPCTNYSCTTPLSSTYYTKNSANGYTFKKTGTYYIPVTLTASSSDYQTPTTGVIKVTVTPKPYTLTRKPNVNEVIYRSLPDGLDVTHLFTSTATSGGAMTYTLCTESGVNVPLNGTTLPDELANGKYIITCSQAATDQYEAKIANVILNIVGIYERNIIYKEASGTGSFSFDTHDMTETLGVTTPIYIWTANATNNSSLSKNDTPLTYTQDDTGNYRTLSATDLTLKMPNTHFFEFLTDYPTYTVKVDARSTSDKTKCTEMKTDYVVEYNRANSDSYIAKGFIYSVAEKGSDNTPVDYLRYTVNISKKISNDFWPVPSGFNKTTGYIENYIEECPLTFSNGTYNCTAGTNDDLDYTSGSRVFTHYTKGTQPANGNGTTIPTSGTYYKFTPEDGNYLLTVGIKLDKRCKFWLLDVDGSSITSRTELGSGLETWNGVNGTVSLFTQAGHEYYFFSEGTPLGIYGYHYSNNPEGYYEKHGFLVRDKNYDEE